MSKSSELGILAGEIDFIEAVAKEIAGVTAKTLKKINETSASEESVGFAAINGLRFYVALEDIFTRIAKVVDGVVPTGEQSHFDLLRQMAVPIPGKRPAVISKSTMQLIDQLRSFRHRMIHAYHDQLEWWKMSATIASIPECMSLLSAELTEFRDFLLKVSAAAESKPRRGE